MIHRVIEDQATILRLLVEHGLDGHIKPTDPTKPGVVAMFPAAGTDITDENNIGKYYIADKQDQHYTLIVLEGCNLTAACAVYESYAKRNSCTDIPILNISARSKPFNN
jgi:hypothetical protein